MWPRHSLSGLAAIAAAALSQPASALRGLSLRNATAADPCECKNWKKTYSSKKVKCGRTNEFYVGSGKSWLADEDVFPYWERIGKEFCTDFFETINDKFCVNVNMGEDKGSWCFVDAKCGELNGGSHVNKDLSWKFCKKEKDSMLRYHTPEELRDLATENKWDLGMLHKMSYPLSKRKWRQVSSFWNATLDAMTEVPAGLVPFNVTLHYLKSYVQQRFGNPNKTMAADMRMEMQQILDSDEWVSFDTGRINKSPPHVIVRGQKVYLVLPDLVCIKGCEGTAAGSVDPITLAAKDKSEVGMVNSAGLAPWGQ